MEREKIVGDLTAGRARLGRVQIQSLTRLKRVQQVGPRVWWDLSCIALHLTVQTGFWGPDLNQRVPIEPAMERESKGRFLGQ